MRILYLDLETTGNNHNVCGIYQICAIFEIDGEIVDSFTAYMNPGDVTIMADVEDMMKDIDLATFSDQSDVFTKFIEVIENHTVKADKFHICGYNVHFDDKFLRAWFHKNRNGYFGRYFYSNLLDVMSLASFTLQAHRHKLPNFKLETLCKCFGIDIDAHDARSDIIATYKIYKGLSENIKLL